MRRDPEGLHLHFLDFHFLWRGERTKKPSSHEERTDTGAKGEGRGEKTSSISSSPGNISKSIGSTGWALHQSSPGGKSGGKNSVWFSWEGFIQIFRKRKKRNLLGVLVASRTVDSSLPGTTPNTLKVLLKYKVISFSY